MDMTTLLMSMGSMGGLGALFSAGLAIANKKLHVDEDPRIARVADHLPGANCGGCGYAGCAHFAENVVAGGTTVAACTVADPEGVAEIAAILGVEAVMGERKVARVMCQGGEAEAAKKADYMGIRSCLATHMMAGGEKLCSYGCIGYGECVDACPFDAMYMNDNGLPAVLEDKCNGCGNCAEACPRGVIEIHPVNRRLFVFCKNQDPPKVARKMCTKACIGCQICARALDDNQIVMENNLAVIDYEVYGREAALPTDRCSTNCLMVVASAQTTGAIKEAATAPADA